MTISPSDMTARVQEWADSFSLDGLDKFPGLYTEDAVAEGSTAPTQAPTEGVRP